VAERYPADNRPFYLKITREDHTADPTWPGWGWRVDMISADPTRDITARGIGIYSDDAWQNYLYTTGSFIDDGSGNYYTECPVGQRTATADDVYFALLLGSAQEGTFTLPAGQTEAEANFWKANQGSSWADSGATTNGMAGTVTLTSPDNSAFSVGQTVRIDGTEFTVTSKWTSGGLILNPYQVSASGLVIEVLT
jgi:hypothetical protein